MEIDIKQGDSGLRLRLRVKPGGRRNAILGGHGGALKISVTAPPEKGKANQAVVRLLARTLDMAAGDLSIVAGSASRDKVVEIRGVEATVLLEKLRHTVKR